MLYAIYAIDGPDGASVRQRVREKHLERIQKLVDEGRLVLAGPFPKADTEDIAAAGVSGSLIVGEFASLEAARAWAEEDPYSAEGGFASVDIRPFKQVAP
ncbi:MAG: YciI family protein [Pseudomonadota bacterium]